MSTHERSSVYMLQVMFEPACTAIQWASTLQAVMAACIECLLRTCLTLDRPHSKMILTIDEHGSKIARNSVFDCHLSPVWRQMAIKNSVSNYFLSMFVNSINLLDCRLSGVCLSLDLIHTYGILMTLKGLTKGQNIKTLKQMNYFT